MRLGVLLLLLCLSLVALSYRSRLQAWMWHSDPGKTTGQQAPELPASVRTLDGKQVNISAQRGHVVLLHFWTFACGNCEHMLPSYSAWNEKYRSQGLVVIGVHTPELPSERNIEALKKVLRDKKITWTVVDDRGEQAWDTYGVKAWPTSFVIDKAGTIRGTFVGDDTAPAIDHLLTQLL